MRVKSIISKLKSFILHPQYLLYSTMAWRCGGTTNTELVENLFRNRIVQTTRVKEAMLKVINPPTLHFIPLSPDLLETS
jgi:hypothetical protein